MGLSSLIERMLLRVRHFLRGVVHSDHLARKRVDEMGPVLFCLCTNQQLLPWFVFEA